MAMDEVDEYIIAEACHQRSYEFGRLYYQYKHQHDSWWTRFWAKLLGLNSKRYFAQGYAKGHAERTGCHGC